MTRRFFAGAGALAADRFDLDVALAHRLTHVLRARAGDELVLFDGEGTDARVRIDAVGQRAITVEVVERRESPAEPRAKLHLYQSISKGERFEWLVEKATEVGAHHIIPLIAGRSVVRTQGDAARVDRWRRIAVEAAEQSGRGTVPVVEAPTAFAEAIASAPGIILLAYEGAGASAPDIDAALAEDIDALFALSAVSVFIGPEGGFEAAEVEQARTAGAVIVTLGERVLRSETAGLVALTLVMHATGSLG